MEDPPAVEDTPPDGPPGLTTTIHHIEHAVTSTTERVNRGYYLLVWADFSVLLAVFELIFVFWLATMQAHKFLLFIDFLPVLSVMLLGNVLTFVAFIVLWRKGINGRLPQ